MSSLLSFKHKKEIFHRKVEPARVSIDDSDSPVSKEDIQSSSPSLQDSEKVCGFTEIWCCKQKPTSVHVFILPLSFCLVFSSRKTVEQKQGRAVKTSMVQWDYQTMWVRFCHTAFAAELNELCWGSLGMLYVQHKPIDYFCSHYFLIRRCITTIRNTGRVMNILITSGIFNYVNLYTTTTIILLIINVVEVNPLSGSTSV